MYSVTQKATLVKQPSGGYINPTQFTVTNLNDQTELYKVENINAGLVGLAVDYMTRYLMGTVVENAFKISLLGASVVNQISDAQRLLNTIKGLDDVSITCACKLTGYDVCFRAGIIRFRPVDGIIPDAQTISNIRTMVIRSVEFLKQYGPIIKNGFTFEGGYTNLICAGDGDFLTVDTLWDFKVSNKRPTRINTLQLLMYYLMGMHSKHEEFYSVKQIGIFNARLNNVYLLETSEISKETINEVSKEVIGY